MFDYPHFPKFKTVVLAKLPKWFIHEIILESKVQHSQWKEQLKENSKRMFKKELSD